jgi:hypothetical protein
LDKTTEQRVVVYLGVIPVLAGGEEAQQSGNTVAGVLRNTRRRVRFQVHYALLVGVVRTGSPVFCMIADFGKTPACLR